MQTQASLTSAGPRVLNGLLDRALVVISICCLLPAATHSPVVEEFAEADLVQDTCLDQIDVLGIARRSGMDADEMQCNGKEVRNECDDTHVGCRKNE